jgi:hypothetical protein
MSIGDESYGEGTGGGIGFETARGRDYPSVRQFNIFLANRMGAMLDLVRRFEMSDVAVISLTVIETADCAIIRLVPSDYARGLEVLESAKLAYNESELILVKLPDNAQPLLTITKALLSGEVNLNYCYPLLIGVGPMGNTALAIHVPDAEAGASLLQNRGFTLFNEDDLRE